ncbi:unnamed protein product [Prorocentrum cordatum]|uniref:Uncharacterized protein n=1 Tax=Prorocentrum cordatum TaxID=2364126 RepID=A0ABN9X7D1_9DINO|nr:unnamed protein product [Polarella glacialis]
MASSPGWPCSNAFPISAKMAEWIAPAGSSAAAMAAWTASAMATGSAGGILGNVSAEDACVECYGLLGTDAGNAARTGSVGMTARMNERHLSVTGLLIARRRAGANPEEEAGVAAKKVRNERHLSVTGLLIGTGRAPRILMRKLASVCCGAQTCTGAQKAYAEARESAMERAGTRGGAQKHGQAMREAAQTVKRSRSRGLRLTRPSGLTSRSPPSSSSSLAGWLVAGMCGGERSSLRMLRSVFSTSQQRGDAPQQRECPAGRERHSAARPSFPQDGRQRCDRKSPRRTGRLSVMERAVCPPEGLRAHDVGPVGEALDELERRVRTRARAAEAAARAARAAEEDAAAREARLRARGQQLAERQRELAERAAWQARRAEGLEERRRLQLWRRQEALAMQEEDLAGRRARLALAAAASAEGAGAAWAAAGPGWGSCRGGRDLSESDRACWPPLA